MVPDSSSNNWHCKYEIKSDPKFLLENKNGYIMLQTEMYGFDEEVNIVVQKHNEFKDLDISDQDPYALPKIF